MAYLIDTDILIYSIKKYPQVQDKFKENENVPKFVSVISYGELVFGAKKSQAVEKNLAIAHHVAEIFPVIEISKAIIETFAGMKAELQRHGLPISDMDLLIAATALTNNLTLVSNNEKHFSRVPGLILENWSK